MATLLARGQITIAAIRDGAPGPQGKPGKDAVSIIVEDAPLVFDTDDNGIVSPGTSKTAKVKVMKGNQNVSNQCIGVSSRDDMCVNCKCYVTQEDGYITVSVSGNIIAKDDVVVDGVNHVVSATSGYAVAQAAYDGVTYFAQVPFSINVAKFTGIVAFDNKSYKSKFKEVSNRLDGAATKYELTQAKSEIEQTAREISLSVSEKSIGRRNMLVGSACRKYRDGFIYMSGAESQYYDGYPLEQIEKNSGIDGVNCIHCRTKQTGTNRYYLSGFSWFGNSPQGNIKLEKGKNYVLSFYAKTHTPNDIYFTAEVLYQGSKIDTSRPAGYSGPIGYSTTFAASEADKWELFTVKVSVPSNAPYEYVEINIFARARSYSFVGGYICKPMLEEGENYNGWTLSEQDYDYVGGNLLDNARTLDKSGTLTDTNDTVIQNGYGTDSACIKNLMKANATPSDFKEVLKWRFGSTYLVNGNDYIFSFVATADVDNARVVCYMWSGDIENSSNIFTEGNGGAWNSQADGNIVFILSRQWTRYWVHWRPKDGYATPKQVLIRHTGNNSTSASTVYVAQPKLEIGATMTEWTERKSDLIDKASLKKAGIEVKSDEVLLYGDRIRVDNNGQTAAMFIGGKLNASLIDADKIEVKHLWAKSEDGITKVGYFGNYEIDACKVNNANAPLFVGADTAAKSPFYVTNEGHMVSTSATLGCFLLDKTSLRYISGYDDEEPGFALYNNFMLFREYSRTLNPNTHTWKSERKRTVWLGEYRTTYQLPALLSNLLIDDSFSADDDTLKSGIRISVTGCNDKYQYEDNRYNGVFQSKVYGNFAIYAEHGMYGGLRPMTRTINRSMELTDMDCFVIVTKGVTITLPAKPQRGQYYKFLQTGDNFVIKSSLNNMFWYGVGKNSFTSGVLNQTTELIYDGSNWNVNWFIGK
jgi:hypothetical protein